MSEEVETVEEIVVPSSINDLEKKSKLKATVTRLELYGAFVDIGLENPAIIHISQLGKRVNRVSDALNVGDEVEVWVDKVDPERGQVMVSMIEPLAVEWGDLKEGQVYTGKVTKLENFGAFIDIGAEKEGLAHVSELSHEFVKHPSEVLKVGEEVEVQVLTYSRKKRRINLSLKALQDRPEAALESLSVNEIEYEDDFEEDMPTAMEMALRNALGDEGDDVDRAPRGTNKKARRKKRRRHQADIVARTLAYAEDEDEQF